MPIFLPHAVPVMAAEARSEVCCRGRSAFMADLAYALLLVGVFLVLVLTVRGLEKL
ncbi:hypothetical protein [Saccharothrix sp. ALI-22-I]|uniref:hypothetical protein n=1 Tax=Saccharothrix sp. ALI-22-I TaxID=1933778 RepID=UPI0015C3543B|nr:hypothetical protein [Saccharothrix sp. ALI-22-I]